MLPTPKRKKRENKKTKSSNYPFLCTPLDLKNSLARHNVKTSIVALPLFNAHPSQLSHTEKNNDDIEKQGFVGLITPDVGGRNGDGVV